MRTNQTYSDIFQEPFSNLQWTPAQNVLAQSCYPCIQQLPRAFLYWIHQIVLASTIYMAKIFIYALWEVLPFILNLCAITSWCLQSVALKETLIILFSLCRCIEFPPPSLLWCVFFMEEEISSSFSLDWNYHCPSLTIMTDQQIRKQGRIIVHSSLSFLKRRKTYNSMVYFGLQCMLHVRWVSVEVLNLRTPKGYTRKAEFLTELPSMPTSEKQSHSAITLML